MNTVPKLVVSETLGQLEWQNSSLLEGDVVEKLTRLKQQPGKNILVSGSITLVGSLLRHRLLDELGLMVCPILVGSGKRLFEDGGQHVPLALVESVTLGNGVMATLYRPVG